PCGFCGMDNTCLTTLIKKASGTVSIISNCIYHHAQMKYKTASTFKPPNICTNVPIHCPFCLP
ncbi:hypothetical protein BDQ17DRAFT_1203268, partial [Cyathus striatus]